MKWFDTTRIPPGSWPFLRTAHAGFRELEVRLEPDLDLTEGSGEVLLTGCLRAYREAVIRRALDLVQSAAVSWNAELVLGSIVCCRALLETLAVYHSFLTRISAAVASKDWRRVGDLVDAYAFSTMSGPKKRNRTIHSPPGIKQAVADFIREVEPKGMQFWEQICDVVHPNGQRMMSYAGVLRDRKYLAKPSRANEPLEFVAVYNCLHSCCWLIASDTDFEIILETIRAGAEPPKDHPLIKRRDLIDDVVRSVSKEISPLRVGPKKRSHKA